MLEKEENIVFLLEYHNIFSPNPIQRFKIRAQLVRNEQKNIKRTIIPT
jgi:hypothetical protein